MSKLILTDIDDVLLDWRGGFVRFMAKNGFSTPTNTTSVDSWINSIPAIRGNGWVERFNNSEDFGTLEPFEDALRGVAELHQQGCRFICISMVGEQYETKIRRYDNLQKYFPNMITSIIHTEFRHGAKREYLSMFSPTAWIEDNYSNAVDGADAGHTSYLITRNPSVVNTSAYNDPRLRYTSGWDEIVDSINMAFAA